MGLIDQRLKELGIVLPPPSPPMASYVNGVIADGLLFVSGKGPLEPDGRFQAGKVGSAISTAIAYQHARLTGLHLIAAIREQLGDLDRVKRIVRVFGLVNAEPDFTEHAKVINGCSDLLVEVFGERGRHSRAAIGMGSLPLQTTVEIEAVVAVK
jgi:enamine deaminase RidA (YjgF/YER057c/UK114 family)